MNLDTFIQETLIGIKNGVQEANNKSDHSYFRMMQGDHVDYDVALIVSEKQGVDGQAKLGVPSIASAGVDFSIENQDKRISRIKFSIKVRHNEFGVTKE